MTADKFHDALTLLSADLVANVDRLRTCPRKPKVHWARWASMAACLAVVLYCGMLLRTGLFSASSTDSAAQVECAAETEAAAAFNGMEGDYGEKAAQEETRAAATGAPASAEPDQAPAEMTSGTVWCNAATQYILTPDNPASAVNYSFSPRAILIGSRAELDAYYEENQVRYELESFRESCRIYDDAWFAENDLLLVITPAATDGEGGFAGLEVTGLNSSGAGEWEICVADPLTADAAETVTAHILLDIRKGAMGYEDSFVVIFDTAS